MEKWTVKQAGDKVSGTAKGPDGEAPIVGEIVTGGRFFRVQVQNGNVLKLIRASVSDDGNSMDGSCTIGTDEILWSATRSK
jgi:hypothetical protein